MRSRLVAALYVAVTSALDTDCPAINDDIQQEDGETMRRIEGRLLASEFEHHLLYLNYKASMRSFLSCMNASADHKACKAALLQACVDDFEWPLDENLKPDASNDGCAWLSSLMRASVTDDVAQTIVDMSVVLNDSLSAHLAREAFKYGTAVHPLFDVPADGAEFFCSYSPGFNYSPDELPKAASPEVQNAIHERCALYVSDFSDTETSPSTLVSAADQRATALTRPREPGKPSSRHPGDLAIGRILSLWSEHVKAKSLLGGLPVTSVPDPVAMCHRYFLHFYKVAAQTHNKDSNEGEAYPMVDPEQPTFLPPMPFTQYSVLSRTRTSLCDASPVPFSQDVETDPLASLRRVVAALTVAHTFEHAQSVISGLTNFRNCILKLIYAGVVEGDEGENGILVCNRAYADECAKSEYWVERRRMQGVIEQVLKDSRERERKEYADVLGGDLEFLKSYYSLLTTKKCHTTTAGPCREVLDVSHKRQLPNTKLSLVEHELATLAFVIEEMTSGRMSGSIATILLSDMKSSVYNLTGARTVQSRKSVNSDVFFEQKWIDTCNQWLDSLVAPTAHGTYYATVIELMSISLDLDIDPEPVLSALSSCLAKQLRWTDETDILHACLLPAKRDCLMAHQSRANQSALLKLPGYEAANEYLRM